MVMPKERLNIAVIQQSSSDATVLSYIEKSLTPPYGTDMLIGASFKSTKRMLPIGEIQLQFWCVSDCYLGKKVDSIIKSYINSAKLLVLEPNHRNLHNFKEWAMPFIEAAAELNVPVVLLPYTYGHSIDKASLIEQFAEIANLGAISRCKLLTPHTLMDHKTLDSIAATFDSISNYALAMEYGEIDPAIPFRVGIIELPHSKEKTLEALKDYTISDAAVRPTGGSPAHQTIPRTLTETTLSDPIACSMAFSRRLSIATETTEDPILAVSIP
jgi:hypothetical protein